MRIWIGCFIIAILVAAGLSGEGWQAHESIPEHWRLPLQAILPSIGLYLLITGIIDRLKRK